MAPRRQSCLLTRETWQCLLGGGASLDLLMLGKSVSMITELSDTGTPSLSPLIRSLGQCRLLHGTSFFIHMLSLPSRGTNEEIIFNSLLFPHDSGHSFLSLFFFSFPVPPTLLAYQDLLNLSRFLRRILFPMMQKILM